MDDGGTLEEEELEKNGPSLLWRQSMNRK